MFHEGRPLTVLACMDSVRVSGPARQLLAAASAVQGTGMKFRLGLFCRGTVVTPLIARARGLGLETHVLPSRWPADPTSLAQLLRAARDPDVSILQTHGYKANVLAGVAQRRIGRPWVAFVHGLTAENARVRFYYWLERLAIRRADRVVVMSEAMRRAYGEAGIPAERLRVVHNAWVTDGEMISRHDTGPVMTVGVVARLSPEKGVDIALRAFALASRTRPEVRLLVAGDGPERGRLERLARQLGLAGRVGWEGHVEEISAVYARLTLLVIPSRSEGLPNVALEAMGAGVPVVATDVGGLGEVIADDRTGVLVPPEDPAALAAAIENLLSSEVERRRLSNAARAEIARRFSVAARIARLRSLYDEVAAS